MGVRGTAVLGLFLFWFANCCCLADSIQLQTTGNTISATGSLTDPNNLIPLSFTLQNGGNVILQTFSYGGGTNAAGSTIAGGGFLPELAVFDASGNLVLDGSNAAQNLVSTDPISGCDLNGASTNKVQPSSLSGSANCGDIYMDYSAIHSGGFLAAGTYTLDITSLGNNPNGVLLSNGFSANGSLADVDGLTLLSNNFAVDVTTQELQNTAAVPEPSSILLLLGGVSAMAFATRRRSSVLQRF